MTISSQEAAAGFNPLRPRLIRIAYRMLGSVADAEDVVHEAFLRWIDVDRDAVREPEAYLRRVTMLKSARHRRETYIGPGCRNRSSKRRTTRSTISRCR